MTDPDRMDLTIGVPGLALVARGLFGITFLMGVGACLAATAAALQGELLQGLCIGLGGATMLVFGGLVALSTGGRQLDRARGTASTWWGLLGVTLRRREVALADADAVLLHRAGANHELCAASLRGIEPRFELFRAARPHAARAKARKIARFLQLPLHDNTLGTPVVTPAAELGRDFAARNADAVRPPPRTPRHISVEEGATGATFRFPSKGLGTIEWVILGGCALLALPAPLVVLATLLAGGPAPAADLVGSSLSVGAFVAVLLPTFVLPVLKLALTSHVVTVSATGLDVQESGFGRRHHVLSMEALDAIVHLTRAQLQATPGQRFRPGELCLRHEGGELHLGAGQPDQDLAWTAAELRWQLVRASDAAG